MSLPTTPARSAAFSTPSTPSTAQHGVSPQRQLTPRSKIKAMLAEIDEASESEPHMEDKEPSRRALSTIAGNTQALDEQKGTEHGPMISADEEEDEDIPIAPRGRLAARLSGNALARRVSDSSSEGVPGENAYARIKKQLLLESSKKAQEPSSDAEQSATDHRDSALSKSPIRQGPPAVSDHARSTQRTPIRSTRSSPGLLVTPTSASKLHETGEFAEKSNDSDSDIPASPRNNSQSLELVARNRAEREARQAAANQKTADRMARQRSFDEKLSRDASPGSGLSDDDEFAEKILTQQSRPTRKASKKALEEMNRETQRMSRNMQLAHQARTRKKVTKDSFFARFNFRNSLSLATDNAQNPTSSTAASSAPGLDLEDTRNKESPPTSPIKPKQTFMSPAQLYIDKNSVPSKPVSARAEQIEEDLPSILDLMTQPVPKLNKGKRKAVERSGSDEGIEAKQSKKSSFMQVPIKVHPPNPSLRSRTDDRDSDSDLEVLPSRKYKTSKIDVFDRLPASKIQEGRSLQALRALAHLNSPEKQAHGKKATLSYADMQVSLQRRARQQLVEERAAKIEDLKSRGIVVQTVEEREKEQLVLEDLLDKARREATEIQQKEKKAAKKEKVANGEVDGLADSSDEDEDYQEDEEQGSDVELSGSDEEMVDQADEGGELGSGDEEMEDGEDPQGGVSLEDGGKDKGGLLDDEASEDENEEEDDVEGEREEDEDSPEPQVQRSRRAKMVIDDDDEDEDTAKDTNLIDQGESAAIDVPKFPSISGPNLNCTPMGMTQAFAATMADTQTQGDQVEDEQGSMAFLDSIPEPNVRIFDVNDSQQMVEDSQNSLQLGDTSIDQNTDSSKDIELHFSQSQIRYDALLDTQMATQISEMPDPTQDVGFVLSSPAPVRFVSDPPSTVDTILLPGAAGIESPIVKKKGRLRRRTVVDEQLSDMDEHSTRVDLERTKADTLASAFDIMKKAKDKPSPAIDPFDKKKSEAKGMVEEQAQESEDEYAGLGGPSDDESGGEEDEYVKEMIDEGEVNVDERGLAAFYANKELASNEKAVGKLLKDIDSGMLRRKRGAEFDLSDSDDDAEARQRRKRREFAKMRKALLENENVGKIAEDPKKLAFLRAIEDRDDDDDLDFFDRPAEDSFRVDTGTQEDADSQSQQVACPESSLGKRQNPHQESVPNIANTRPPAAARRTQAPKKPATLADIRESVSFLIEDPGSIKIAPDPSSSASEDEAGNQEGSHRNSRRRANPNPIIDRLSIKRAGSASTSSTSRLAFHDPSANPSIGGFKVPSLLRRATTSQLAAAANHGITTATAATERAAGGGEKGDFVRQGGTKRSSVNYFARELEKKSAVQGIERRKNEGREAEAKRRGSGLGVLGVGSFE